MDGFHFQIEDTLFVKFIYMIFIFGTSPSTTSKVWKKEEKRTHLVALARKINI